MSMPGNRLRFFLGVVFILSTGFSMAQTPPQTGPISVIDSSQIPANIKAWAYFSTPNFAARDFPPPNPAHRAIGAVYLKIEGIAEQDFKYCVASLVFSQETERRLSAGPLLRALGEATGKQLEVLRGNGMSLTDVNTAISIKDIVAGKVSFYSFSGKVYPPPSNLGDYLWELSLIDNLVGMRTSVRYSYLLKTYYDAKSSTGYIVLPKMNYAPNFEVALLKELAKDPGYAFKGYSEVYIYAGNNKGFSGASAGGIAIDLIFDINSPITVGGYHAVTDGKGNFHFAGNASMSRITEGVIPITDSNGNIVSAVLDTSINKWVVKIDGMKGGMPYSMQLEIDALNK